MIPEQTHLRLSSEDEGGGGCWIPFLPQQQGLGGAGVPRAGAAAGLGESE